jgi:hypothetical protein
VTSEDESELDSSSDVDMEDHINSDDSRSSFDDNVFFSPLPHPVVTDDVPLAAPTALGTSKRKQKIIPRCIDFDDN